MPRMVVVWSWEVCVCFGVMYPLGLYLELGILRVVLITLVVVGTLEPLGFYYMFFLCWDLVVGIQVVVILWDVTYGVGWFLFLFGCLELFLIGLEMTPKKSWIDVWMIFGWVEDMKPSI